MWQPHSISCPLGENYIQEELGVKMYPFNPAPIFVGKSIKLPYPTKNLIDSYKYISKNLLTLRWGNLNISDNPAIHAKLFGKKNKYPKTGSPELIHALANKLKEAPNVTFKNGLEIESILIDDKVTLKTDSEAFSFDSVYLTSVSKIQTIHKNGQSITVKPKQVDYIHYLLELNKPLNKKMTYWRIMDDEVVHRYTDISYQCHHEENLVLAGIKPDPFHSKSEEELLSHVINHMKGLKLIDDSHQIELIKTHLFPTYYSDKTAREEIAKLDDRLQLLHSTDLMYGMYYMLKEEGEI